MEFALDALETKTLSEAGVEVTIRRLDNGQPLIDRNGHPVKIRVLGPDSERYRRLTRDQVRKRLSAAAAGEKFDDTSDEDALEILVACTCGWSGIYSPDGNPVSLNAESVRALYTQFPAIRDQVDRFITNRVNFIKASSAA